MDEREHSLKKCEKWLEKCEITSNSSELTNDSDLTNNSEMASGFQFIENGVTFGNLTLNDENVQVVQDSSKLKLHKKLINSTININKSKKVHIGDVNYYYVNGKTKKKLNAIKNETQIDAPFRVIKRRDWLAQPPLEINYMEKPAKYVIVCHSATEDALTLADNTLLVRLIQSFHMDSRKWSDIGYNFLIGNDGTIFEGRGFNVIGAHTKMWNSQSLAICFVGTYVNKTPTLNALKNAQELIDYAKKINAIDDNYTLLGHCQCIGTESPGRPLFEIIKKWKNFDQSIDILNPPSMILPFLKNSQEVHLP